MENYNKYYQEVIDRIEAVRKKQNFVLLSDGFFKLFASSLLFVLLIAAVETLANGDTTFRTFLAGSFFVVFTLFFGLFLLKPIMRAFGLGDYPDLNQTALIIGKKFPEIKDKLGNALQLMPIKSDKPVNTSKELAEAAFYEVYLASKEKDFESIIDNEKIKRNLIFFIGSFIISVGSIIGFNPLSEGLYRTANFSTSFIPPAPFELTLEPIEGHKLRGEKLLISVKAEGDAPESIRLYVKEEQQMNFDEFELSLDSLSTYYFEIPSLKHSVTFYAEADWMGTAISTQSGEIIVTERPVIRSISGNLVYPNYTELNPRKFNEQNADITALRGSRIELSAFANKDLETAFIYFESVLPGSESDTISEVKYDTLKARMRIDGRKANGRLYLVKNGTYHIKIKDIDGESNQEPIKYSIVTLDDAYPSISMIEPTTDVDLTTEAILPMRLNINDDYGFSKIVLNYKLVESPYTIPDKEYRQKELPLVSSELSQEIPYVWDLNELAITPRDKYEFFIEVFDNDIVSGPKSAKTDIYSVRLPALSEIMDQTERNEELIEAELSKVLEEADKLKKEMKELNRELLKNSNKKEMTWETKKKAEELLKKQNDLKQDLNKISKSMEENTREMQQNDLISQETLQKYQELQNLLKQVDSPELREMQRKMQDAMKKMSPEEMRNAMEEMKFADEQMKQSIERSIKMLKRIQAEQKSNALAKQAEKMKEQQDNITKEMNETSKNDKDKIDELSKKQEHLNKEMDDLQNEMDDLKKLMEEIGKEDMPMEDFDKAMQELNPEQTKQEMQQSKQNMQKQDFQKAQKNQQQSSQNLQNFSQQMQQMKENMEQQSIQEAIKKMQKQVSDLLDISKEQEELQKKTKGSSYNSTNIPEYAQEQAKQLDQLMNVGKEMMKLSEKSFAITPQMGQEIGNSMKQMQESLDQLSERRSHQASQSQNSSMSSLNKAISQMQSMISQMQQGQGACSNPGGTGQGQGMGQQMGLAEQMRKMAAQQQMLNQGLQQMMQQGNMGSGQMSQEKRAKMQRLQREQGEAAKSIKEMAEEQKKFAGEDKETAKKMSKIAKEMEEVVKDIESGQISEETLKRQERILSRLLDANRSINKRDFEKRRESKTGKDYKVQSPEALDMMSEEGKKKALRDLMKDNTAKYTKDYEILINKYFESLESIDFSEPAAIKQ